MKPILCDSFRCRGTGPIGRVNPHTQRPSPHSSTRKMDPICGGSQPGMQHWERKKEFILRFVSWLFFNWFNFFSSSFSVFYISWALVILIWTSCPLFLFCLSFLNLLLLSVSSWILLRTESERERFFFARFRLVRAPPILWQTIFVVLESLPSKQSMIMNTRNSPNFRNHRWHLSISDGVSPFPQFGIKMRG